MNEELIQSEKKNYFGHLWMFFLENYGQDTIQFILSFPNDFALMQYFSNLNDFLGLTLNCNFISNLNNFLINNSLIRWHHHQSNVRKTIHQDLRNLKD
jgi:ABC-type long-subunit fatty acid transport system fused permease/ATPase subunit